MDDSKITELIDKIKAAQSVTERRALRAELRRVRRGQAADRGPAGDGRPRPRRVRSDDPGRRQALHGVDDPDAAAIETWPPELRARLGRSAYSRVVDGRPVEDPGGRGERNDLRRWSPWL